MSGARVRRAPGERAISAAIKTGTAETGTIRPSQGRVPGFHIRKLNKGRLRPVWRGRRNLASNNKFCTFRRKATHGLAARRDGNLDVAEFGRFEAARLPEIEAFPAAPEEGSPANSGEEGSPDDCRIG